MNAPSPRCGRLDDHAAHEWHRRSPSVQVAMVTHNCPGHTVVEGSHPCVECGEPTARCSCEFWRREERAREWSE